MGLAPTVEILPAEGALHGDTFFSSPRPSDETLIAEIGTTGTPELFCHRYQTDQLQVLRGAIDLVVVQDRQLRRITLREGEGSWLRIPPGVPHGAINRGRRDAVMVNAVLRHGPSHPRDYRPLRVPPSLRPQWTRILEGA